jgi:large subunit ribosomal protein L25
MDATLDAKSRDQVGKNEARRLRETGWIPAVLYGGARAGEPSLAQSIAVDPKTLSRILHSPSGVNSLISLSLDGAGPARVMVREYQIDPVSHRLLHADFYRVAMDKVMRVTVPILVKGEAAGVKQEGGLLDLVHREVEVECLPADIPGQLEVDVTALMMGDAVRVKDLAVSPVWRVVSEPEMMLVHVIAPKAEVSAEAEAAATATATPAAPAEPEVIKKGKVEKPEEE